MNVSNFYKYIASTRLVSPAPEVRNIYRTSEYNFQKSAVGTISEFTYKLI